MTTMQPVSTTPGSELIEGPAFPPAVKIIASVVVAALVFWGIRSADQLSAATWTMSAAVVMLAGLLVVGIGYYWILRSRTAIDATHIQQTWMWRKRVALEDVAHVKVVYVPYLSWIIVPRLVVRSRGRAGLTVFQVGDRQVLAEFAKLHLQHVMA